MIKSVQSSSVPFDCEKRTNKSHLNQRVSKFLSFRHFILKMSMTVPSLKVWDRVKKKELYKASFQHFLSLPSRSNFEKDLILSKY